TDEEAVVHTSRGTLGAIRRSLKEGRLGDASNVRASRSKSGPFELLRNHPEFRDLVIEPAALTAPQVKKSSPPNAVPAPPPLAEPVTERPVTQIPLGPMIPLPTRKQSDWVKWVLLLLIAAAAGVIGFFLLPMLWGGKMPP